MTPSTTASWLYRGMVELAAARQGGVIGGGARPRTTHTRYPAQRGVASGIIGDLCIGLLPRSPLA